MTREEITKRKEEIKMIIENMKDSRLNDALIQCLAIEYIQLEEEEEKWKWKK